MKSDIEIKDDIYKFIRQSRLYTSVTGKLCKRGKRPKGSHNEDIVISVLANENGQIQDAVVNVNIYVSYDKMEDGQNEESSIRLRELCRIASETLEVGGGEDFRFTLAAQRVLSVDDADVSVINNKLEYKQVNE